MIGIPLTQQTTIYNCKSEVVKRENNNALSLLFLILWPQCPDLGQSDNITDPHTQTCAKRAWASTQTHTRTRTCTHVHIHTVNAGIKLKDATSR